MAKRTTVLRFEQVEQMALGWKDVSVARANGSTDVFGLAGFFRDNDPIGHNGSFRRVEGF
jgi:hypothetical protein